jgi:hypothetical protein
MSDPDYILDLSSLPRSQDEKAKGVSSEGLNRSLQGRPWIAVHWKCCQTYSRIYRNAAGTAYEGKCPRCGAPVKASVGQAGTRSRFFEAQ